jgi:hypothetical protein
MEELEDKIYEITSDVQDFLADSEEFRIELGIELKKMKELNEALIATYSDLVTENAEKNIFIINNILGLIKEQKEKENSSSLNELVKNFENKIIFENEAKRKSKI